MSRILFLLALLSSLLACGISDSGAVDDGDARVIATLKEAGSDLSKPHPIDFYFVKFPDRASAERFGKALGPTDWKLDVHQTPGSSDWTVIASTVMIPDLDAISISSAKFKTIAPKYGGDYDGWEAAVTP